MSKPIKVKEVINILCQLLQLHNYPKLPPEVFRQAKFDRPEASSCLLLLINAIINRSSRKQILPSESFTVMISLLYAFKYPRLSELSLYSHDNISSRELLLVFGFLLEKMYFFDRLRKAAIFLLAENIFDEPLSSLNTSSFKKFEVTHLNDLIVLRKHIDIAFRVLFGASRHITKLLNRAYSVSEMLINELNKNSYEFELNIRVIDFLLLGDIKLQKKMLPILTKQLSLLKLHSKWLKNEAIFWNWMCSVTKISNFVKCNNVLQLSCMQRTAGENSQDDFHPSMNVKSALMELLITPLQPFIIGERRDEGKIVDLMAELQSLKENNKIWLAEFLEIHFPNLVHMDSPRR